MPALCVGTLRNQSLEEGVSEVKSSRSSLDPHARSPHPCQYLAHRTHPRSTQCLFENLRSPLHSQCLVILLYRVQNYPFALWCDSRISIPRINSDRKHYGSTNVIPSAPICRYLLNAEGGRGYRRTFMTVMGPTRGCCLTDI